MVLGDQFGWLLSHGFCHGSLVLQAPLVNGCTLCNVIGRLISG